MPIVEVDGCEDGSLAEKLKAVPGLGTAGEGTLRGVVVAPGVWWWFGVETA